MLIGKSRRWLLAAVLPLVLAGCASQGAETGTAGPPAVRHVWVIELENEGYQQSFGTPSADPSLALTLPRMGALLENYHGIGHASADNYVAEVSGQAPSLGTQAEGCVYPPAVQTVGNQLSAAGFTWAAYLQDMGNNPARDNTVATARGPACGHPATGTIDRTQKAAQGDQYAVRHDGFAFFASVTGNPMFCAAHILAAPAYRDGGLIVVTFDEGSGETACCGETAGLSADNPNVPACLTSATPPCRRPGPSARTYSASGHLRPTGRTAAARMAMSAMTQIGLASSIVNIDIHDQY